MEQYIMPCLLNLVNENNDEINIECISVCLNIFSNLKLFYHYNSIK
jgi:hypothetical protein